MSDSAASMEDSDAGARMPVSSSGSGQPGSVPATTMGSAGAGSRSTGVPSGSSCEGEPLSVSTSPANVLLLVDRSTSMLEPVDANVSGGPSRWDAVTGALRSFLDLEQTGNARIGLQFFGLTDGNDDCSIDKYRTPAVEVAPIGTNHDTLVAAIDAQRPGSLTPATPAVTGALEYSLQLAQRPENAGIPGAVIWFFDGVPSECGTVGLDGTTLVSVTDLTAPLERFSQPPRDASNNPTQPPIRTFVVGMEPGNANVLARAGSGQAFVVGGAVPLEGSTDVSERIVAALGRIVARPLGCELDVPAKIPGSSEPLDLELVRVKLRTAEGATNELARTAGPGTCTSLPAWHYADSPAGRIAFCPSACELVGGADVQVELGCAPQRMP